VLDAEKKGSRNDRKVDAKRCHCGVRSFPGKDHLGARVGEALAWGYREGKVGTRLTFLAAKTKEGETGQKGVACEPFIPFLSYVR